MHNETVRIVDAQLRDMAVQMAALDEFVTRAREQNGRHYDSHYQSLNELSVNVRQTFENIDDTLQASSGRMENYSKETRENIKSLEDTLSPLTRSMRNPLAELKSKLESNPLIDYVATGETPQKKDWVYPTDLPRTENHDSLLARLKGLADGTPAAPRSPKKFASPRKMLSPRKAWSPSKLPSPTKAKVFLDDSVAGAQTAPPAQSSNEVAEEPKAGLKEMDMNVLAQSASVAEVHSHPQTSFSKSVNNTQQPPLKRHATAESRLPRKGRENNVLSQSVGPGFGIGRRLRSSPQQ